MTNYYSREIIMPKTMRDGLANFVQIIINRLEAGETREALLSAVDLRQDIDCGTYDNAMADAKGHSAIIREMEAKHAREIATSAAAGYASGVAAEKSRMASALRLIP